MERVQVSVNQGTMEGKVLKTANDFAYRAFLGIPFAKPPVGDLRFRDPVPAESWDGVLDATNEPNVCPQFERLFKKVYVGNEDCLYLNIYVPDSIDEGKKLPVMFWVHGGSFINGSCNGDIFGPDHLVEHNVILVTTNYRLGPLGFLSLDIAEAPGNVGLKDQAMALKWVNENIHEFGGDPENLTLFGESAGGASINFLLLSPMTHGMYKRAILQSGTSVNEWAIQRDNVNNAFKLGGLLGIETENKIELINHLLNLPAQELVMASYSTTLGANPLLPTFVPIVEQLIPSATTFLDVEPRSTLRTNNMQDIPIMIGCTSNEGYMAFLSIVDKLPALMAGEVDVDSLVPDFSVFVPSHLRSQFDMSKIEEAAQKIKEFYFSSDNNLVDQFLDLSSDLAFVKDIDHTAKMYANQTKTFYYKFAFKGSLNIFQLIYPLPYNGATHADELAYLFSSRFEDLSDNGVPEVTERETLTIKRMTEMWTNFAKYGNPTPTLTDAVTELWRPISEENIHCLVIDEELSLITSPFEERMKLWEELEHI